MSEEPSPQRQRLMEALTTLDLQLDTDLFDRIAADVDAHGAELGPAEAWEHIVRSL